MNQCSRKLRSLQSSSLVKRRLRIAAVILAVVVPGTLLGQTTGNTNGNRRRNENKKRGNQLVATAQPAPLRPLVDHHTHISSVNASALTVEPLLPVVELPEELTRLLRDKERWGGKEKNPAALTDLYTKDALVLDPVSPSWFRGERAVNYVIRGTEMNRLVPTAFEVNGLAGYIAGYEAVVSGTASEYVSNFFYSLKKGDDGKWRIAAEIFTLNAPAIAKAVTSDQLIKDIDAAGIKRAVVLSVAYWFGSRISRGAQDEYAKVRAENDWAADQVSRHPARLVGFCSFNPLKDYAFAELDRCASSKVFKGLKLHFGMSEVDLKNPEHVQKVRQVFAAANRHRLPIIVHVRADRTYGREHAEILLNQILPSAPDITVQIAHLWGGEGFSDSALTVYADAVSTRHPATKNLYFDVTELELVLKGQDEKLKRAAMLMRQIGLGRILFGSDGPRFGDAPSREAWTGFRTSVPLTQAEFMTIAGNVAPYLR